MDEESYKRNDFLNRLLAEYFKYICSFREPANKFINWFLTVIGFTISILFYNLETLDDYFRLSNFGWIFFWLLLSGIAGIISKYFFFLSDSLYKVTEQFLSFFPNEFEKQDVSPEEKIKIILEQFPAEIQNRLFPKILKPAVPLLFKQFKKQADESTNFQIAAKSSLWQCSCIGLSILFYVFATIYLVGLFLSH